MPKLSNEFVLILNETARFNYLAKNIVHIDLYLNNQSS